MQLLLSAEMCLTALHQHLIVSLVAHNFCNPEATQNLSIDNTIHLDHIQHIRAASDTIDCFSNEDGHKQALECCKRIPAGVMHLSIHVLCD